MRRRLNKLEQLANLTNLLLLLLLFWFIIMAAFVDVSDLTEFAGVCMGVMLLSAVFNLAYWILWQRFNK